MACFAQTAIGYTEGDDFPVKIMYQTNPPRPPQEVLPTMYDLPSEDPEEPGLPDEFHEFQPQLLRETFRPPDYP